MIALPPVPLSPTDLGAAAVAALLLLGGLAVIATLAAALELP